mgnify:FL=1|jgi:hypothetical protein
MDSERIAMIIDEKEYWHPSDDEHDCFDYSEEITLTPFETIIDTSEVKDGKVTGIYERDHDGNMLGVQLYEVPKGFTNAELCILTAWLHEHYVP